MCLSIKVKGLQDAVTFAMGAIREHKDVCALNTRSPSHQPQSPGQCLMAQDRNFTTIMAGHHEDGGKQWHQKSNQPHVVSCCKKPSNLWVKKLFCFCFFKMTFAFSFVECSFDNKFGFFLLWSLLNHSSYSCHITLWGKNNNFCLALLLASDVESNHILFHSFGTEFL